MQVRSEVGALGEAETRLLEEAGAARQAGVQLHPAPEDPVWGRGR